MNFLQILHLLLYRSGKFWFKFLFFKFPLFVTSWSAKELEKLNVNKENLFPTDRWFNMKGKCPERSGSFKLFQLYLVCPP